MLGILLLTQITKPKMKKTITLFFILAFLNSYSQDYLEKIALNSCDCISEISDSLTVEGYSMELGLCIINSSMPYKKELKKDHGIDMDHIDEQGEELGTMIALKMASTCPDGFMAMAKRMEEDNTAVEEASTEDVLTLKGVVTKVDQETFNVISIKDESGKTTKFYWLTFIEANIDLVEEFENLAGRSVDISYNYYEFFDPRINEYRNFYLIETLNLLDE